MYFHLKKTYHLAKSIPKIFDSNLTSKSLAVAREKLVCVNYTELSDSFVVGCVNAFELFDGLVHVK